MGMKVRGKTNSNSTSTSSHMWNKEEEEEEEEESKNIIDKGSKVVDEAEADQVGFGQGELYSPVHALRLVDNNNNNNNNNNIGDITMGVVGDMIRRNFGAIKERLMEKLSAAAVAADALANACRMVETVLQDVTVAAHALSKDALHRIKTHLIEILPSLSPALTTKLVDESDNTNDEREDQASKDDQDTTLLLNKPSSKL